jgi:hypothetical protein
VYFILSGAIPEENQIVKEGEKISSKELTGFSGLISIFTKLNQQALIKNRNKVNSNDLERNIYSQERKNVYSQGNKVELDGHETRSGINIDWRAKLIIILVFIALGYFLWKFGLLNFLNF